MASKRGNPQNLAKGSESRGTWKPGQSGNPSGRPRKLYTLITYAMRDKLGTLMDDPDAMGAKITVAERLSNVAFNCVLHPDPEVDKTRLMALDMIIDRVEGKATQRLDVNDVTKDIRARSDHDLAFYVEKGHWPEEAVRTEESIQ